MIGSISSTSSYLLQLLQQVDRRQQDDLFTKVDTSGDNKVDKTEFSALAKKLSENAGNSIDVDDAFSTYDTDGDGTLSADELSTYIKENAPPPSMGGPMTLRQGEDDFFGKIDEDGNGSIGESEFTKFASKMSSGTGKTIDTDEVFSTFDVDNDGSLSKEELNKFMQENAPPPPLMQNAMSAYESSSISEQLSELIKLLKEQTGIETAVSLSV